MRLKIFGMLQSSSIEQENSYGEIKFRLQPPVELGEKAKLCYA